MESNIRTISYLVFLIHSTPYLIIIADKITIDRFPIASEDSRRWLRRLGLVGCDLQCDHRIYAGDAFLL